MKIFFDTEFTGLTKDSTLISIGLVAESGEKLYCELNDYDKSQVNDWIRENVIANLGGADLVGTKSEVGAKVKEWLSKWDKVEMWASVPMWDWVLFCDLWGSAFDIPKNVYYIPFDLATLLKVRGIDPDVNLEEYSRLEKTGKSHNALWDAIVCKACYEKAIVPTKEYAEMAMSQAWTK